MKVDAYWLPDAPLTDYAVLGLIVLLLISMSIFIVIIVRRPGIRLRISLLAILAAVLFIGSIAACIGYRFTYSDGDGLWACPSSVTAAFITETGGQPLPEGVAECRSDARRNLVIAAVSAMLGVGVTVGVYLRHLRKPAVE